MWQPSYTVNIFNCRGIDLVVYVERRNIPPSAKQDIDESAIFAPIEALDSKDVNSLVYSNLPARVS